MIKPISNISFPKFFCNSNTPCLYFKLIWKYQLCFLKQSPRFYPILELERDEKQIESRWVNRELWNWKTNSLSDKYCLEKPLNCFFLSEYLFFLNGIFSQRFQERKSHFARAPRIHSSTLASRSSWRSPSIGSSRANRFPLSGVLSKRVRKNSPTTVFFIPFLPILFYCFLDS